MTDIVKLTLQRAAAMIAEKYGLPDEVADIFNLVEVQVKNEYGGERVNVHKPVEDKFAKISAVKRDYLANLSERDITGRHGISRATMFRYLKK